MLKNYTDVTGDSIEVDVWSSGEVFIQQEGRTYNPPVLLSLEQVKELIEQLQEALDNQAQIN